MNHRSRSSSTAARATVAALTLLVVGAAAAACGSDSLRTFDQQGADGGGGGAGQEPGNLGSTDAGEQGQPTAIGHMLGKVFAPEGTVPISGALVYLTTSTPAAIPQQAYCDKCVELPAGTPFTYSKPDGSFDLPVYAAGTTNLVVQKGQFRRYRSVEAVAGTTNVPAPLSTLPGAPNAATGDDIPRIAVAYGGFDKIELSLKKLGLTSFDRYGKDPFFNPAGLPPVVANSSADLLNSKEKLASYHIVLLPCAVGGLNCSGPSAATQTNLRDYVSGGGKLYVTDYSYEYVKQTWPGFITWKDKDGNDMTGSSPIGSACQEAAYTQPGTADDTGLGAWLDAIGEKNFNLRDSWTIISKVNAGAGKDADGNPTTITPKIWMTSDGTGPSTVSFENQCGRVLFSTYHAEGGEADALLAQEKALLYILLEVGVCVGEMQAPH